MHTNPLAGAKAIVTPTLVRLGILKGHGKGLLHGPKLGQWNVRDDRDLRTWWDEIVRSLKTPPHGPYQLVAKIFGPIEAERQVGLSQFPGLRVFGPGGITSGRCVAGPSTSPSKRRWDGDPRRSQEYEEDEDDEHVGRREKRQR